MFAIKTEIRQPGAKSWHFVRQKTMYGGRTVAQGDTIFVFASENEGAEGLVVLGRVTEAEAIPKQPGIARQTPRQTPRVSIRVEAVAKVKHGLGRSELRTSQDWNDGRPETELNFKLYRQATNKIVGISAATAAYLSSRF